MPTPSLATEAPESAIGNMETPPTKHELALFGAILTGHRTVAALCVMGGFFALFTSFGMINV